MGKWSTPGQREAVTDLYLSGKSVMECRALTGFDRVVIYGWLRKAGIPLRPSGKTTQEQREAMVQDYLDGLPVAFILAKYGLSDRSTLADFVKRRGHQMRRHGPPRQYTVDETVFDTITEHSAYWIGFLLADGAITNHGPNRIEGFSVSTAEKDRRHLETLRAFLKSDAPIKKTECTVEKGYYANTVAYSLYTYSKRMALKLMEYGVVPRKTYGTTIPPCLAANRHFWRGVIDGDGSISLSKCKSKTSPVLWVSLVGCAGVVDRFIEFARQHIPSRANRVLMNKNSGNENCWGVSYSRNNAKKLLNILYKDSAVSLPRKYAIAGQFFTNPTA